VIKPETEAVAVENNPDELEIVAEVENAIVEVPVNKSPKKK
jgi:hypothetical protein